MNHFVRVNNRVRVVALTLLFVCGMSLTVFASLQAHSVTRIPSSKTQHHVPLTVGFLVDASSSATLSKSNGGVEKGVRRFVEMSPVGSEYFLTNIGTIPKLLLDKTEDHAQVRDAVSKADKARRKRMEKTAFWDACYFSIRKFDGSTNSRRALVVISDGVDTVSERSFADVLQLLKQTDITFYAITPQGNNLIKDEVAEARLDSLATSSGGEVISVRSNEDVIKACERIVKSLSTQPRR